MKTPDSFVDTRGFGMKVYNVPGRNLLSDPTRLGEAASQDFTLNSTEPFFSDNAERYAQFMRILTFEAPTLEKAGGAFVKKTFLRWPSDHRYTCGESILEDQKP